MVLLSYNNFHLKLTWSCLKNVLIFQILNSSSKSATYTNVLLCCWDSFLTDASYLGALSAEDIYMYVCLCVCVCAWRHFPSPWLHVLLRDFHVIFHAILMFNTNEDVPKNIWMRKYGKLSVKRLCWSLFQLSCKLKMHRLQLILLLIDSSLLYLTIYTLKKSYHN